jgi:tetratricopeptide (TPR) repeat protein
VSLIGLLACCAGLCAMATGGETPCVFRENLWETFPAGKQRDLLRTPPAATLDSSCFSELLGRLLADTTVHETALLPLLRSYCTPGKPFSVPLLLKTHEFHRRHQTSGSWNDILRLFERQNGDLLRLARELMEHGRYALADSLFLAFDDGGETDAIELIEWARCKAVLRHYRGAASLVCRAQAARQSPAQPFQRVLRDAPEDTVAAALRAYESCLLSAPRADSAAVKKLMVESYATFGLERERIAVLLQLERSGETVADELLGAAETLRRRKKFSEAVRAALLAYDRCTMAAPKNNAALILYDSYSELDKKDSALMWLRRFTSPKIEHKVREVVLCQELGMLSAADSSIDRMPESFVRDTLRLRQLLFGRRPAGADSLASTLLSKPQWRRSLAEARVWHIRTCIFSGDIPCAAALLDSLHFEPSWQYAGELLGYRYSLARLRASPGAAADWGMAEYAIWRGEPHRAVERLDVRLYNDEALIVIARRLAPACIEKGFHAEALRLLEADSAVLKSPEMLYYYGKALMETGRKGKAGEILNRLLAAHPDDVFSGKARILIKEHPFREVAQ